MIINQVKRLYETFHEPFKRVVSHKTTNLGTPTKTAPVPEGNVNEKDEEDSGEHKKEPELTVKSALAEAFTKYSGKVGETNNKTQLKKKAVSKDNTSVDDSPNP